MGADKTSARRACGGREKERGRTEGWRGREGAELKKRGESREAYY